MSKVDNNSTITLWTSQSTIVLNTIDKKGIYHVKKEFISKKYGEVANIFLEPYNWFVNKAEKIIPKPEGAQYPIWLFTDPKYVERYEDNQVLQIEVDLDKVILFNPQNWNRILNLSYIPKDDKDAKEYYDLLERQGIYDETNIYLSSYYPYLKMKVKKSWDRLFDDKLDLSKPNQAALWELRREWIVSSY